MIRGVEYGGVSFAGQHIELAEVEQTRFDSVRFTGARTRQLVISDAEFTTCDLAQFRAEDTSLIRTVVTGSRLTGSSWSKSHFLDVTFDGRADMSHWRHSVFKAAAFTDCNLRQADFQWASLRDVTFTNCELTGTQFAHAEMTRVRFENCTMHDIGGGQHLKGATVQGPGAMEFALALARDAGIRIEP